MSIKTTTLTVYTYLEGKTHESQFEVTEGWLQSKIEVPVEEFLSSYTCDNIHWLYELAQNEAAILSEENKLIEIDGHKFRVCDLRIATEHFNITQERLLTYKVKVYQSYMEFFTAYFIERFTKEELIEMMYSDCTEPPDDEYVILDNGQVLHINS